MYILFTILIVISSILLTLIVLVQNSKGGGLSAGFSSSNQIMGVRKTTDFLEKATWALVAFVLVLSVASVAVNRPDVNVKEYQNAQKAEPGVVAPNFGENPEAAPQAEPQAEPAKK